MSIIDKVISAVTASKDDQPLDAIDLLKKDHDDVDELLKDYAALTNDEADPRANGDRRELSAQICGLLAVHAMIEEEIFYPAARRAGVKASLLNEAQVEHASAKDLIAQIGASKVSDPLYDARVTVLGEYIRHHVREEEQELFPECRKAEVDMVELGAQLEKRRAELMRKLNGASR
jgi:iron-sulfur cluster repair protein YtfE (RIC family)